MESNLQYLTSFLKYLPRNMALIVQILGRKKLSIRFRLFKTKKKFLWPLSRGGGAKALAVGPLKKELFLRLPFITLIYSRMPPPQTPTRMPASRSFSVLFTQKICKNKIVRGKIIYVHVSVFLSPFIIVCKCKTPSFFIFLTTFFNVKQQKYFLCRLYITIF